MLLQDLFGFEIAEGRISRLQSFGGKAKQAGVGQIVVDVRNPAAVNLDETGWLENSGNAWFWAVVGRFSTWFAVRAVSTEAASFSTHSKPDGTVFCS